MSKPSTQYVAYMKCTECGIKWRDLPRGSGTTCPNQCGSKYFKWLNYEQTFGQHHYSELEEWEETYGKLTNKKIKKLLRKK